MLISLLLAFGVIFVLAFTKIITALLLLKINTWRHETGHVIPHEKPTFPYLGDLNSVNFFGREKSKRLGSDIYCAWSALSPVLVIGNAKAAEDYYPNQKQNTKDYGFLGWVFQATMGASLGVSYGARWEEMRNMFTKCFNGEFVKNQFNTVSNTVNEWINSNIISKEQDGRVILDLAKSDMNILPVYILTRITYGEVPINGKEMQEMVHFLHTHENLTRATNNPLTSLPGYRLLPTQTNKLVKHFLSRWEHFNYQFIADCKEKKSSTNHSILRFLIDEGLDERLTKEELLQTLYEITLFNVDISHNALVCVLAQVANDTKVQRTLQQEIDGVFRADGEITFSNLGKMPYLDAVIKESARMNPSLTLSFPEKTTDNIVVDGYFIPKNTQVCIDAHTLNFNPKHWENPDTFCPARFLDSTPPRGAYHRFGIGARKCLGAKYADMALKLFVGRVFHEFDVSAEAREGKTKDGGFVFFIPYVNTSRLIFTRRV